MIVNIVSNLSEESSYEKMNAYNHIIAWSLREALEKTGIGVHLVSDTAKGEIHTADHTLVISNMAMTRILSDEAYRAKYRQATRGLFCLWIDGPFSTLGEPYDRILTVSPTRGADPAKYRQVGWAANPDRFRPEQREPTAYVDTYMYGFYGGRYDGVYDTIKETVKESGLRILQTNLQYNKGRVPWAYLQELFRQAHFHIGTQVAHWGWTEIEAATCGSLLVFNRGIDRPETWPSPLNHAIWENKEQLLDILSRPVDVEANRAKALENTWHKVVSRIEEALR